MNTDLVTTVAELRLERRAVAASCARLEALQFVKRAPHTQHCGSGFRAHVRAAVRLKRFERNLCVRSESEMFTEERVTMSV